MSFSKYIKELRAQKALTQQELAESLNISLANTKQLKLVRQVYPV